VYPLIVISVPFTWCHSVKRFDLVGLRPRAAAVYVLEPDAAPAARLQDDRRLAEVPNHLAAAEARVAMGGAGRGYVEQVNPEGHLISPCKGGVAAFARM
jgi:hypothetical protein